jgi:uncharacterized protein YrrD
MRLAKGADVYTTNGEQAGKIDRVVMNPRNGDVTHVVVEKGFLFTKDYVVPVEYIEMASEDRLTLKVDDEDRFEPFEETHFIQADDTEMPEWLIPMAGTYGPIPYYYYGPVGTQWSATPMWLDPYQPYYVRRVDRNIPADTVALEEGADVFTSDDEKVGNVAQVITEGDRVTHFVVSKGLFFKEHKLVPTVWIRTVAEGAIRLGVASDYMERLPEYEPAGS